MNDSFCVYRITTVSNHGIFVQNRSNVLLSDLLQSFAQGPIEPQYDTYQTDRLL